MYRKIEIHNFPREPDHPSNCKQRTRYGQGIEAEVAAELRKQDPAYSNYTRKTHPDSIKLINLIGGAFSVLNLRSMSRDLANWGVDKIGRDDFRNEWSLVRYLVNHFDIVARYWNASAFSIQSPAGMPTVEPNHRVPLPCEILNKGDVMTDGDIFDCVFDSPI
jgi:hypothetical protein